MRTLLGFVSVWQAMTSSLGFNVSNMCGSNEGTEMIIQDTAGLDDISFLQAALQTSASTFASRPAYSSSNALGPPINLATRHQFEESMDEPKPSGRTESLKPVVWLDIAEAGTSFINVWYHNPTLCPGALNDAWLEDATNRACKKFDTVENPRWDACPGGWSSTWVPEIHGTFHISTGHLFEASAERFAAMLSLLEQRMIPDYSSQLDDHQWVVGLDDPVKDLAKGLQGCVVKLFAQLETELFCDLTNVPPPTEEEVTRAVQRLEDGFGELEENKVLNNNTPPEPLDTSALDSFVDVVIIMGITFIIIVARCYV